MNGKDKTIKYRIRTGSQWLLISLMITSTILPGINETASASTRKDSVLKNIDSDQEEKSEVTNNSKTTLLSERSEKSDKDTIVSMSSD